jgi:hypothetical protein
MPSFLMTLALCLAAAAPVDGTAVVRHASSDLYRIERLHSMLQIGSNPNEDIRTNVLLNMEGL